MLRSAYMQYRRRFSRIVDRVYPPDQQVTNPQATASTGINPSSTITNSAPGVANGGQAAQGSAVAGPSSQNTTYGSGHTVSAAVLRYARDLVISIFWTLTLREVLHPRMCQTPKPLLGKKTSGRQNRRSRPRELKSRAKGNECTNYTYRAETILKERAASGDSTRNKILIQ